MAQTNKPTFLGVGVMKSGTTWIVECLREHPEVFMSEPKELHYFSRNRNKGIEWYYNFFQNKNSFKAIGEFSNTYFDDPEIPRRIIKELGSIKIIICIRNPIERFVLIINIYYEYIQI